MRKENEIKKAIRFLKKMNKYYERIMKARAKGELGTLRDIKGLMLNWEAAAKEIATIEKRIRQLLR